MALNPNDLLIFQEREKKKEKKPAKQISEQIKPQVQAPSQQPASTQPQPKQQAAPQPTQQYVKPATPVAPTKTQPQPKLQPQSPQLQPQPSQPQRVQAPKPSPKPAAVQQTPSPKTQPITAQPRIQPQIQKVTQTFQKEASAATAPSVPSASKSAFLSSVYTSIQPTESEIESIINNEFGASGIAKRTKISRSEAQSREEAKGQYCVWHPWRPAYAICNYCSRPFCYEDIVEYNNNYYCLEDIDKVSTGAVSETSVKYNNLSMVSAIFFVAAFMLFIYFANNQVAYVTGYANSVGFFTFLSKLNYSYGSAIIGLVLALFSLVAGILIFAHSDKGFAFGLGVGAFDVLLFSYNYASSAQLYSLAIGIVSFIALVLLLLSREAYESVPASVPENSYMSELSNVSKF